MSMLGFAGGRFLRDEEHLVLLGVREDLRDLSRLPAAARDLKHPHVLDRRAAADLVLLPV